MPKGRTPKPPEVHRALGTYRADRHGRRPSVAIPDEANRLSVDDCPDHLPDAAKRIWHNTLPGLYWLHKLDGGIYAVYCALQAEFESNTSGMQTARISLLRQIGNDLGISSVGRARLGLPAEEPAPRQPDAYFD